MKPKPSWLAAVAVALPLAGGTGCSGASAGTVALEVNLRSRSPAPGEPVRLVVDSPVPLASLSATFLDREIFMVHAEDGAAGPGETPPERWSGWAMIGLDREPGMAAVEVEGLATDGRPAAGTRAVTILRKVFPTEDLKVAPRYVTPPPEVRERLDRERTLLARLYETRTALPPQVGTFIRPVPGEATSVFGTRRFFNGEPRSPHPGLDLKADAGTPVRASGPGNVLVARDLYYSGHTVIIDHGGGLFTLYAHLSRIDVEEGRNVVRGEVIAASGATGRVTGPHLHWGAKIGDEPFDPTALLDEALFR